MRLATLTDASGSSGNIRLETGNVPGGIAGDLDLSVGLCANDNGAAITMQAGASASGLGGSTSLIGEMAVVVAS